MIFGGTFGISPGSRKHLGADQNMVDIYFLWDRIVPQFIVKPMKWTWTCDRYVNYSICNGQ